MAISGQPGDEPIAAINVTPLVDVMLVLLVIFMITARLGDEHALPLDLPEAASGAAAQRVLTIAIDASGARTLDGAPAGDDAVLRAAAARVRARSPQVRAVIQADRRASHGDVMRALDSLRVAGIHRIAFAVEPSS
jgi:biopolymer transport protein ExbD